MPIYNADLNTQYLFSENATGSGSLGYSHLCLCVYYGVYWPGLCIPYMHVTYTCQRKLLCLYVIMGGVHLSMVFIDICINILVTAPIYANVYVTGVYVSSVPAF